jgi:hypothetical protein
MTGLKGMDKLFWGKKFEDVIDQIERLEMHAKVQNYNEIKHKNHTPHLKGKAKDVIKGLSLFLEIGLP